MTNDIYNIVISSKDINCIDLNYLEENLVDFLKISIAQEKDFIYKYILNNFEINSDDYFKAFIIALENNNIKEIEFLNNFKKIEINNSFDLINIIEVSHFKTIKNLQLMDNVEIKLIKEYLEDYIENDFYSIYNFIKLFVDSKIFNHIKNKFENGELDIKNDFYFVLFFLPVDDIIKNVKENDLVFNADFLLEFYLDRKDFESAEKIIDFFSISKSNYNFFLNHIEFSDLDTVKFLNEKIYKNEYSETFVINCNNKEVKDYLFSNLNKIKKISMIKSLCDYNISENYEYNYEKVMLLERFIDDELVYKVKNYYKEDQQFCDIFEDIYNNKTKQKILNNLSNELKVSSNANRKKL